jgi:hypothetical protein
MTGHVAQTGNTYMTHALLLLVMFAGVAGCAVKCSAPLSLQFFASTRLVNLDAGARIEQDDKAVATVRAPPHV